MPMTTTSPSATIISPPITDSLQQSQYPVPFSPFASVLRYQSSASASAFSSASLLSSVSASILPSEQIQLQQLKSSLTQSQTSSMQQASHVNQNDVNIIDAVNDDDEGHNPLLHDVMMGELGTAYMNKMNEKSAHTNDNEDDDMNGAEETDRTSDDTTPSDTSSAASSPVRHAHDDSSDYDEVDAELDEVDDDEDDEDWDEDDDDDDARPKRKKAAKRAAKPAPKRAATRKPYPHVSARARAAAAAVQDDAEPSTSSSGTKPRRFYCPFASPTHPAANPRCRRTFSGGVASMSIHSRRTIKRHVTACAKLRYPEWKSFNHSELSDALVRIFGAENLKGFLWRPHSVKRESQFLPFCHRWYCPMENRGCQRFFSNTSTLSKRRHIGECEFRGEAIVLNDAQMRQRKILQEQEVNKQLTEHLKKTDPSYAAAVQASSSQSGMNANAVVAAQQAAAAAATTATVVAQPENHSSHSSGSSRKRSRERSSSSRRRRSRHRRDSHSHSPHSGRSQSSSTRAHESSNKPSNHVATAATVTPATAVPAPYAFASPYPFGPVTTATAVAVPVISSQKTATAAASRANSNSAVSPSSSESSHQESSSRRKRKKNWSKSKSTAANGVAEATVAAPVAATPVAAAAKPTASALPPPYPSQGVPATPTHLSAFRSSASSATTMNGVIAATATAAAAPTAAMNPSSVYHAHAVPSPPYVLAAQHVEKAYPVLLGHGGIGATAIESAQAHEAHANLTTAGQIRTVMNGLPLPLPLLPPTNMPVQHVWTPPNVRPIHRSNDDIVCDETRQQHRERQEMHRQSVLAADAADRLEKSKKLKTGISVSASSSPALMAATSNAIATGIVTAFALTPPSSSPSSSARSSLVMLSKPTPSATTINALAAIPVLTQAIKDKAPEPATTKPKQKRSRKQPPQQPQQQQQQQQPTQQNHHHHTVDDGLKAYHPNDQFHSSNVSLSVGSNVAAGSLPPLVPATSMIPGFAAFAPPPPPLTPVQGLSTMQLPMTTMTTTTTSSSSPLNGFAAFTQPLHTMMTSAQAMTPNVQIQSIQPTSQPFMQQTIQQQQSQPMSMKYPLSVQPPQLMSLPSASVSLPTLASPPPPPSLSSSQSVGPMTPSAAANLIFSRISSATPELNAQLFDKLKAREQELIQQQSLNVQFQQHLLNKAQQQARAAATAAAANATVAVAVQPQSQQSQQSALSKQHQPVMKKTSMNGIVPTTQFSNSNPKSVSIPSTLPPATPSTAIATVPVASTPVVAYPIATPSVIASLPSAAASPVPVNTSATSVTHQLHHQHHHRRSSPVRSSSTSESSGSVHIHGVGEVTLEEHKDLVFLATLHQKQNQIHTPVLSPVMRGSTASSHASGMHAADDIDINLAINAAMNTSVADCDLQSHPASHPPALPLPSSTAVMPTVLPHHPVPYPHTVIVSGPVVGPSLILTSSQSHAADLAEKARLEKQIADLQFKLAEKEQVLLRRMQHAPSTIDASASAGASVSSESLSPRIQPKLPSSAESVTSIFGRK